MVLLPALSERVFVRVCQTFSGVLKTTEVAPPPLTVKVCVFAPKPVGMK